MNKYPFLDWSLNTQDPAFYYIIRIMKTAYSSFKPWDRLGINKKLYLKAKPWKRTDMSREKFEALIMSLPQDMIDEARIGMETEDLVEALFSNIPSEDTGKS